MPNHSATQIHSDDDHPLSSDEITTFNCQSDKKISSRYTQLRKQLRSCEHFKENYFVLEVNKPTKSSQDTTEKKKRKKRQTVADDSHPDESLSNDDGSEEMKKKKRKRSPATTTTTTQPSTTEEKVSITHQDNTSPSTISTNNTSSTTTSTTCVNNEQTSNNTTATNQQVSPQVNDGLVLQLMGLLQNNNASNQTCNNQMTLEGLELQIKLLQRLQETINLLKGSSQQPTTTMVPSQESVSSMNSNNSMSSIPSEDMFQQILDYGDCCTDNNQALPMEMTSFASCEDFAELLNGFI